MSKRQFSALGSAEISRHPSLREASAAQAVERDEATQFNDLPLQASYLLYLDVLRTKCSYILQTHAPEMRLACLFAMTRNLRRI